MNMSSNYFNSKQSSPRHIIMKLLKITDKERILKSSNKKDGNLQRNLHWTISVFLRRKVSGRREWNDVFKVLKEKNGHQEYSIGKFIFQKWRINKDFPRQTKTEGLYHYICFTRNAGRSSLCWNKKMLINNMKTYKNI